MPIENLDVTYTLRHVETKLNPETDQEEVHITEDVHVNHEGTTMSYGRVRVYGPDDVVPAGEYDLARRVANGVKPTRPTGIGQP